MSSTKPWDQDYKLKCLNVEVGSGWTVALLFAALGCHSVWTHCPPVWLSSWSSNQTNIVKSSQKREHCVFGEISDMTAVIHPSAVTDAFQSLPCFLYSFTAASVALTCTKTPTSPEHTPAYACKHTPTLCSDSVQRSSRGQMQLLIKVDSMERDAQVDVELSLPDLFAWRFILLLCFSLCVDQSTRNNFALY